jgi:hypothetical protein
VSASVMICRCNHRNRPISRTAAPRSPTSVAVRESSAVCAQSVPQCSQAHAWTRPVSLVCQIRSLVRQ